MSGIEVEYLLKAQESHLKTMIENVDKQNDERMVNYSRTIDYQISKLRNAAKERHAIFEDNVLFESVS